jgi:hypothetical protein
MFLAAGPRLNDHGFLMSMDYAGISDVISKEVASSRTLVDSMHRILDECEKQVRHRHWMRLRKIDYGDINDAKEWITTPFELEKPPKKLKGLWFGLFNPIYEDGETVADIYISGSYRFDPNPDSNDWAVRPE